jgi:hypothetical protein
VENDASMRGYGDHKPDVESGHAKEIGKEFDTMPFALRRMISAKRKRS